MGGSQKTKLALGRVFSMVMFAGGWLFAGGRVVLDGIGYSTAPEDIAVAQTRLGHLFEWLVSVPSWIVWGFALVSTLGLMWVSWPRAAVVPIEGPAQPPIKSQPREPRLSSSAPAKVSSAESTSREVRPTAEYLPKRFIEAIDRDDREIKQRIRLHTIPKPIHVRRYFDAPEPYLIMLISLQTNAFFDFALTNVQGKFEFRGHPLQSSPTLMDPGVVLTRYKAEQIRLQQYLTPHVAKELKEWKECEFNIEKVFLTFEYKDRFENSKTVKFHLRGRCHLVSLE